jgi:uncharacterized protein YndB with AHSA1/START domain
MTTQPRQIDISIIVKADPDRVFAALTDAREIEKWFFPEAHTDPLPGGKYRFVWKSQDPASDHVREGEFVEVIPGKKVSYTWDARPKKLLSDAAGTPLPTLVEFLLERVPEGTRVTLRHSGWGVGEEWEEMLRFHDDGWSFFVNNLRSTTGEVPDRRADEMNMQPK